MAILTKKEKEIISQLVLFPENEVITNPYSGESVELEPPAVALYDYIRGCEILGKADKMQTALTIFRKLWPNEYMILLD